MSRNLNQPDLGRRIEAAIAATHDHLFVGRRRIWIAAAIVALLAWPVSFGVPSAGVDGSWIAGLYMGIRDGKDFGTEIVFTYGPLGFLDMPFLWYSWLPVLALAFGIVIYLSFVVTMVTALERTLSLLGAALVAFLYLVTVPDLEQVALILSVGWALLCLRKDRPEYAVTLLVVAGGSLSALELMIKLSVGPVILLVCLLAMIGARADRRQWGIFGTIVIGGTLALWLIAGQPIGDLWDYARNGFQIASGYNEAMEITTDPRWVEVVIPLFGLAVVAAAAFAHFRDRRGRIAAVLLVAVASFSSVKYGIVRVEPAHAGLALSALLGIWLMIPWRRTLAPAFMVATVVAGAVAIHVYPNEARLDPWQNITTLKNTAEIAIRPGYRQQLIDGLRGDLQTTYQLDPETLALIKGKRLQIDPWEIAVAWAYELDWSPLPVFQNYSAYTQKLDRLNAAAIEDAETGPQVILRQNPGGTMPLGGSRSFQNRLPAWDPPEQNFETVCNFVPIHTTPGWQVLERVANRCGEQKLIGEAEANTGESVQVPQAHAGELVLMRIEGAKIEGVEKLRSLLWRPRVRTATLNDGLVSYTVVPGTVEDGMVVSRDPRLDSTDGFEQLPEIKDLKLEGFSGHLRYKFYSVPVKVEDRED